MSLGCRGRAGCGSQDQRPRAIGPDGSSRPSDADPGPRSSPSDRLGLTCGPVSSRPSPRPTSPMRCCCEADRGTPPGAVEAATHSTEVEAHRHAACRPPFGASNAPTGIYCNAQKQSTGIHGTPRGRMMRPGATCHLSSCPRTAHPAPSPPRHRADRPPSPSHPRAPCPRPCPPHPLRDWPVRPRRPAAATEPACPR
jgi:hypothetical protein